MLVVVVVVVVVVVSFSSKYSCKKSFKFDGSVSYII